MESIKDWVREGAQDVSAPKQYKHRIRTVPWKIWAENTIYDMKWVSHTLGTFCTLCFTFIFLDFYASTIDVGGFYF
jgi:hypothetical protein